MSMRGRTLRRLAIAALLLLAVGLLANGCSSGEAAKLAEAQKQKQAEEQRQREAEDRRLAEERRIAEEKRQVAEMHDLFGPIGEPPPLPGEPQAPAATAAPGAAAAAPAAPAGPPEIAFDEAVPPLPKEPTVGVVVLSHAATPGQGRQVAALLGDYERERLEERLGMAVRIMYVAESTQPLARESEVHYRPDYLRAAQSVAAVLSAQQWIGPMSEEEQRQDGVDLVVHIGKDYR
jgi:hypothetical protein